MSRTRSRPAAGYSYMPALTQEEEAGLRESIRAHGVLQPVLADETGAVIDGHNRARIAAELGVAFEPVTVHGLTEEAKTDLAFSQNMAKRNMTSVQKREVIRTYLQVRPEATDRSAGLVLGVHHQTVGSVRAEMFLNRVNGENHHKDTPPDGILASPFFARTEASGRKPRGRKPDPPAVRERKVQERRERRATGELPMAPAGPSHRAKAEPQCTHCPVHHCPPA